MTEKQLAILESFPKRDRGLFGEELGSGDEEVPELVDVEEDPLEAAAKKAKIKQKAMRERRKAREAEDSDEDAAQKRVRFIDGEQLPSDEEDVDHAGTDSDEMVYDSEEEDDAEKKF